MLDGHILIADMHVGLVFLSHVVLKLREANYELMLINRQMEEVRL